MNSEPTQNNKGPLRTVRHNVVSRVSAFVAGKHALRRHGQKLLKGVGMGIGYATLVEPRWIERTHIEMSIDGLAPSLDGYRIVHVSDIHYNFVSGRRFVERIVEIANGLDPDLIVLPGDFVTHNPRRLYGVFAILKHLRAPDGLLATRGNHDHVCDEEDFRRACEGAGIRLLENEHVEIMPSRHRTHHPEAEYGVDSRLTIAGVGDLWKGVVDLDAALGGAPANIPRILLSHNPAVAERVREEHEIALQLSGHTHGGQVRPFNQPIGLFHGGNTKYSAGLVRAPHTTVYISRGVGTSALYARWNCRPEIALIHLHRA